MVIQSHILIHTIKTAIATALSALVYLIFQIPAGFWMTVSCVIVMQSGIDTGSFESSLRAARDRTLGAIVGSVVGIGGAFLATFGIWWVIPGLVVVTFICVYFTSIYPFLRQAVISAVLIMLIADKGPEPWHVAFARAGSIVGGCLIAALVSLTILPYRAKDHLRVGLAKAASLFATYYRLVIEGEATTEIKEEIQVSLRQNQRVARDLGMALGLKATTRLFSSKERSLMSLNKLSVQHQGLVS